MSKSTGAAIGRPVAARTSKNGFSADFIYLDRLRTALRVTSILDANEVSRAIAKLDAFMLDLTRFHNIVTGEEDRDAG